MPLLGGSRRNITTPFGVEKLAWCGYPMVKKFWRYLYSFWRKSWTWHTDIHCMPAIAALMHSITRQKLLYLHISVKDIGFSWNFVQISTFWTGWMSRDQKWKICIGETQNLTELILVFFKFWEFWFILSNKYQQINLISLFRVTTCMENLEMSGILLKVRDKGYVREKWPKSVSCISYIHSWLCWTRAFHFGFGSCTVALKSPPLTMSYGIVREFHIVWWVVTLNIIQSLSISWVTWTNHYNQSSVLGVD